MPYAAVSLIYALNACTLTYALAPIITLWIAFQRFLLIITTLFLAEITLMTPVLSFAEENGSPRQA